MHVSFIFVEMMDYRAVLFLIKKSEGACDPPPPQNDAYEYQKTYATDYHPYKVVKE